MKHEREPSWVLTIYGQGHSEKVQTAWKSPLLRAHWQNHPDQHQSSGRCRHSDYVLTPGPPRPPHAETERDTSVVTFCIFESEPILIISIDGSVLPRRGSDFLHLHRILFSVRMALYLVRRLFPRILWQIRTTLQTNKPCSKSSLSSRNNFSWDFQL